MKTLNSIFNFAIFAIILGYAGFFFYNQNQKKTPEGKIEQSSRNVDDVVNKYLAQTTEQMAREKLEKDKALYRALTQPVKINPTQVGPNPEDIPREQQISKDRQMTPSEVINAQVYDQQAQAKQEALDKKAYAREFIENARRGGYEIELDSDNKVIKSTPIRKPSQDDDSIEPYPSD